MDDRHIFSQHFNGFLHHILIPSGIAVIQQIHRIQYDLQIRRLNRAKHLPCPARIVYDVPADRFNRYHHSHFFRIFHNTGKILRKRI